MAPRAERARVEGGYVPADKVIAGLRKRFYERTAHSQVTYKVRLTGEAHEDLDACTNSGFPAGQSGKQTLA